MTAVAPLVGLGVDEDDVCEAVISAPPVLSMVVFVEVKVARLRVELRVMCIMPVPADAVVLLLKPPEPGAIRVPPGRPVVEPEARELAEPVVELADVLDEDADEVCAPPEMANLPP